MNLEQLRKIIAGGETLKVEFKGESRQPMSDGAIYEEIVALANTEGGVLILGVEDDGSVTGARPRHGIKTEPLRLQPAIFNNTVPSLSTRAIVLELAGKDVLCVEVEPCSEPCATTAGKSLRRTLKADGKPQSVPFYPREQQSRRIALGTLDYSAQKLPDAAFEDFDPLEIERLKQNVSALRGDASLLSLNNKELVKALRLVETEAGRLAPTVAGLLLIGREEAIRRHIPTHAVHFQVLDRNGNVKVNDAFCCGILKVILEISSRFAARNEEKEVTVGMFRLPIPDYSAEAFREASNNALLHRDYSRMDGVYIQWQHDHMLITSPGGFPCGVTISNLLVHEPKPRNSRLAEAFKRIGLVEQTGRGVDKIYMGQLRYGRPVPDYSRSDETGVRLVLRGGTESLNFAAFVYEQEKAESPLSLDELLVLNTLFFERTIDSELAGGLIQKGAPEARAVLNSLVEKGFIEAKGEKRGRTYHLSSRLYRKFGKKAEYVRAHGISAHRYEGLIMEYLDAHKRIERRNVMELCGVSGLQASRLLSKMCKNKKVDRLGTPPRWVYYVKHQ